MTNPTDNQTPQPVDELEQLIREIMQNGFEVAMGGLYDLTPEENEARQRAEYDRVTAKAEKAIRQAVGEEMLGLVGDNEIGNIGYVGEEMVDETTEEMFYRNQLRAELRQKIKAWQG